MKTFKWLLAISAIFSLLIAARLEIPSSIESRLDRECLRDKYFAINYDDNPLSPFQKADFTTETEVITDVMGKVEEKGYIVRESITPYMYIEGELAPLKCNNGCPGRVKVFVSVTIIPNGRKMDDGTDCLFAWQQQQLIP